MLSFLNMFLLALALAFVLFTFSVWLIAQFAISINNTLCILKKLVESGEGILVSRSSLVSLCSENRCEIFGLRIKNFGGPAASLASLQGEDYIHKYVGEFENYYYINPEKIEEARAFLIKMNVVL